MSTNGRRRVAVLLVLAAAALATQLSGIASDLDPERVEELMTQSGALGPAAFVLAFAATHPVGIPSVLLTLGAAVVWPVPAAVFLSWTGGMAGTFVAFAFARWLGRDWVAHRLPARFRRFDEQIAKRAVTTVILVRLLTYTPPPADWFFGISRIRVRQFVAGTAVGLVPPTVVIVVAGDRVTGWLRGGGAVTALALMGVAVGMTVFLLARRRRSSRATRPDGSTASAEVL